MLKNKFKIIVILSILILALTLPIVRAIETEDDITNNEIMTNDVANDTVNNAITTSDTSTANENFKKSDVYLCEDNVTIDYIIDGNLFVLANNVTINSQIGGDAFICADTITIGEQGYIFSNLFAFSKNVNIDGVVYDLYSASENTTIHGYVYRDIHIGSENVNILGTVGRNAYIDANSINFKADNSTSENENPTDSSTPLGVINGNLKYTTEKELVIPEGVVNGETSFEQKTSFDGNTVKKQIMNLLAYVVTVIAIWLLCLWLAPKFLNNNSDLLTTKKVLPIIGFGILSPIALIVLTIIFFVLGITSSLGLILLFALITLIVISNAMFIITLNSAICNKMNLQKTLAKFGILAAISIILWLIGLIPFVGSILGIIVTVLGLGIVTSTLFLKDKEVTE